MNKLPNLPTLLLHGALGAKQQLDPLLSVLGQQGHEAYAMNFSGHGGKPFATEFGIEAFADDVLAFLNQHNLERISIFGYSMGGYVALWLAHQKPDRVEKIVTLGTKFDWSPESAEREVKKLDAEKIQEKIPAFARILEQRHSPNDWRLLLDKTRVMMLKLGDRSLLTSEHFKNIQHPVSIALGDMDDMADRNYSEEVASLLPNGKFILLQETAHPIEKVKLAELLHLLQN